MGLGGRTEGVRTGGEGGLFGRVAKLCDGLFPQLVEQFALLSRRQISQAIEQQHVQLLRRWSECVREREVCDPGMAAFCVQALAIEFHERLGQFFPRTDSSFASTCRAVDPHSSLPRRFVVALFCHVL